MPVSMQVADQVIIRSIVSQDLQQAVAEATVIEAAKYAAIEMSRGVKAALKALRKDIGSTGRLRMKRKGRFCAAAEDGKWSTARIADVGIWATRQGYSRQALYLESNTLQDAKADLLHMMLDPTRAAKCEFQAGPVAMGEVFLSVGDPLKPKLFRVKRDESLDPV
ncbi:MAG: hypothetical protein WDO70_07690 [Alphaproteobacteria bacterium]